MIFLKVLIQFRDFFEEERSRNPINTSVLNTFDSEFRAFPCKEADFSKALTCSMNFQANAMLIFKFYVAQSRTLDDIIYIVVFDFIDFPIAIKNDFRWTVIAFLNSLSELNE